MVIRVKKMCLQDGFTKKRLKRWHIQIKRDWEHWGVRILILPRNLYLKGTYDMCEIVTETGEFVGYLQDAYKEWGGYITAVQEP